jgi:sugar phosphate isomerase/epimerase
MSTAAPFRLGYGTNGMSDHRLTDALALLADLGYTAVALTLDHAHLDPFAPDLARRTDQVAARLAALGLRCVVETGARYVLDPRRKHQPTLLSDTPQPRVQLLRLALRVAADLDAGCVSFWSGTAARDVPDDVAHRRLRDGIAGLLPEAERRGVPLALEPEPGMLIEYLAQALALRAELDAGDLLGITLDVGHCVAIEPEGTAACIRRAAPWLLDVQLDDARPGVHEHLEFGQGMLDLPATLATLTEVGYRGVAAVELPRHSHAGPDVAARCMRALRAALQASGPPGLQAGQATGDWLADALRRVTADQAAIRILFPQVGRQVGRAPLRPGTDPQGLVHGSADDRARVALLTDLATILDPAQLAHELTDLYRHGDGAERRGVLRALAVVAGPGADPRLVAAGLELTRDALRTGDTGLVAAAMGAFAGTHLDDHAWRHGVLKCLFTGIPLAAVADLDRRRDAELARMVTGLADERRSAGRPVPDDARLVLHPSPRTHDLSSPSRPAEP